MRFSNRFCQRLSIISAIWPSESLDIKGFPRILFSGISFSGISFIGTAQSFIINQSYDLIIRPVSDSLSRNHIPASVVDQIDANDNSAFVLSPFCLVRAGSFNPS